MFSRSVLAFFSLALSFASASMDGPVVQAPFFIRNDESGALVAVVVYGSNAEDQDATFCKEEPDPYSGPNVSQCVKLSEDYYELRLPYKFERDITGAIVGVNFLDQGETIVISFWVYIDEHGRMHARVNAGDCEAYNQITIPYTIRRSTDGDVVAVLLDDELDQQLVPFHYRTNEDGSISAVYYDESLDNLTLGLTAGEKFAIVMGSIFGAILAGVVCCKGWCSASKKRQRARTLTRPTEEFPCENPVKELSEEATVRPIV